jgi:transcriptional accessory protein Tex/SPT6
VISRTVGWYCSAAFNAHTRPQHDPQFLEDQHEVVKPWQIVKAKVIDDDLKRQRIALSDYDLA